MLVPSAAARWQVNKDVSAWPGPSMDCVTGYTSLTYDVLVTSNAETAPR